MQCDICRIIQIVSTLNHRRISILEIRSNDNYLMGLNVNYFDEVLISQNGRLIIGKMNRDLIIHVGIMESKLNICFTVSVPYWMSQNNNNNNSNNISRKSTMHDVEVCNFNHYRPYLDMIQHKKIVNISDMMVIDYGLHYLSDMSGVYTEYFYNLVGLMELGKDAPNCR